jgi:TPR repeat protein
MNIEKEKDLINCYNLENKVKTKILDLIELAFKGDSKSQYKLGYYYLYGGDVDIKKNTKRAFYWY